MCFGPRCILLEIEECFDPRQGDSHLWVKFRCSGLSLPSLDAGSENTMGFVLIVSEESGREICALYCSCALSVVIRYHHPLSLSPTRPMSSVWVSRARAGHITDDPGLVARLRPKLPLSYRHTAQRVDILLPLVARKLQWGHVCLLVLTLGWEWYLNV